MRIVLFAGLLIGCSFEHGRHAGSTVADAQAGDATVIDVDGAIDAPIPRDCLDALGQGAIGDGVVTIDPDGEDMGNPSFDVYCDMTTDGGGWTLVYVYGFTNFSSFNNGTNAASPRPDWPLTTTETTLVAISTQVPSSPTSPGALTFARWSALGHEMLVTSNINHWLRCSPAATSGGEIVATTSGTVSCTIVKLVATACTTAVPTYLSWYNRGPTLLANGGAGSPHYYYWEASTAGSWPTHDPCGTNGTNHLMTVNSPAGAIWLRR